MAKRADKIATSGDAASRTVGGVAVELSVNDLRANAWNPNVQSEWMFEKELASIREFGFVDPIIVRSAHSAITGTAWEIIDGEHRWKAAKLLGHQTVPCWNLGEVEDDVARQLTIVLNETRGDPNEDRLRDLLNDLRSRHEETQLLDVLPFSKERFDELTQKRDIDWEGLGKGNPTSGDDTERWRELVFRMPNDAAKVVEQALAKMVDREGLKHPWQALEMLAADSLA